MNPNLRRPPSGRLVSSLAMAALGGAAFCGFNLLYGSERFYRSVAMPIVHKCINPELSHRWALQLYFAGIPPFGSSHREYDELRTTVNGLQFPNPVGLAAGFDKDGFSVKRLINAGFGFVELGSVTAVPQPGNQKPRVFRLLEDKAVINRYGFVSKGYAYMKTILAELQDYHPIRGPTLIGVSLGKNKTTSTPIADYAAGIQVFAEVADYIAINVSSPNTPDLRNLQQKSELEELLKALKKKRDSLLPQKTILYLKVAPDLTFKDKQDIAEICTNKSLDVDGLIVCNTTTSRPADLKSQFKNEVGGLSGKPLNQLSTECIRDFYKLTKGKVPIIGSGGIFDGEDAYEKIRAGASLVQIYTVLVYEGPPALGKIKRELRDCLKRDGFSSVSQAVGADFR